MSDFRLNTPVAFIIFNRPDVTARVFAEIAKAKPPKLLIVADGARANKEGEAERVVATRKIINQIDWPCEVFKNFSDINLGCKNRVSSGIDWVFEQVSEAIILEDDCLPDPSFFQFCEEMLVKYRTDDRIAMISGDNFQEGKSIGDASYYFSKYPHIWGWATWKRAWSKYDVSMSIFPKLKKSGELKNIYSSTNEAVYWENIFQDTFDGKIDTWDHQWSFSIIINNMLCIMPDRNLISNIGFGVGATHTLNEQSEYANMDTHEVKFPLIHPGWILPSKDADFYTAKKMFNLPTVKDRIRNKIYRLLKEIS